MEKLLLCTFCHSNSLNSNHLFVFIFSHVTNSTQIVFSYLQKQTHLLETRQTAVHIGICVCDNTKERKKHLNLIIKCKTNKLFYFKICHVCINRFSHFLIFTHASERTCLCVYLCTWIYVICSLITTHPFFILLPRSSYSTPLFFLLLLFIFIE